MIRIGNFLLSILFMNLVALIPAGFAQDGDDLKVFATVDRNAMAEGDTFTLTISVSADGSVNVTEPRLPDLSNFDLINTWKGSETRSTFSNGKFEVNRSQTFNYLLAPKKQGTLELKGAEVVVNGKAYTTKPIRLTVVAQGPGKPRRGAPPDPNDPFGTLDEADQLFAQLLERRMQPGFRSQPMNTNEAFFLQVEVDKTKAYANEQVTASWYLYTRGQIRDIDTLKYPSLNGFWKEDIEIATRLDFVNEVVNGLVYKKALLASYALFPIKEGKANIDPYKAKCTVLTPNQFGFGQPMVFTKASRPVEIEVLSLPEQGRPKDFSGAVGQFQVTTRIDSQQVPANQPVSFKVRFEGTGNAKLIDLPALNLPPSIEVYDTKTEAKFFKTGTSFKEFEILLIPREPGDVAIPALSVSAFDPKSKSYYTRTTEPVLLKVLPAAGNETIASTPLARTEEKKDEPKNVPPAVVATWEDGDRISGDRAAAGWTGAYSLAFLFLLWRARVELGWGRRRRDLKRVLTERMKGVHQRLDKGDWRGVGADMTNTVYFVLGELTALGGANVELDKLLLAAPPSVRREVGAEVKKLMRSFEALSFAPEGMLGTLKEKGEMKRIVGQMEKLLFQAVKLGQDELADGQKESLSGPTRV